MSSRRTWAFLLIALAAGCDRGRPEASASLTPPVSQDSVAVTLEAPAQVKAGAPVPFKVVLANATDRQVTLYLLGREVTFDISVAGPDGGLAWRRLDDSSFQEILAVRTLAPRERIVLDAEWPGSDREGRYTATARVLTDGDHLQSQPVRVEVRQ